MEMIGTIIVAGLAGGAVMALVLAFVNKLHPGQRQPDAFAQGRTDVINIASVRVAGLGGLGLMVVAMTMAWAFPRIGQTMTIGAVLGSMMATALILWRRRFGPLPSSSDKPGANTTLSIDAPAGIDDKTARSSGPHEPTARLVRAEG